MFFSKVNKVRQGFLSFFPEIKLETLNLDLTYIEENFLSNVNLPESLLAYMVKMEYLETWTFTNLSKSSKDIDILNNIEAALPSILTSLSMKYDKEVSNNLSYLLARMPIQKTIYIIKFLDGIQPIYLNSLFSQNDEDSKLLVKRLEILTKVLKLTYIFSHSQFNNILQIIGRNHNEKQSS
jgi:hypothetical protein